MKQIKVHLYTRPDKNKEIITRNYDKVFQIIEKDGNPGIDWYNDGGFYPLTAFATETTVVFEEV